MGRSGEKGRDELTGDGILFHAKYAFMPNTLGYCGPDAKGVILEGLEGGRSRRDMVSSLQKFEAAYPFLKLIARNTGREVFDYEVPEAYWIGNELLDRVPAPDFYSFSHRELEGKDHEEVRRLFRKLDGNARPHHSFYVMSTYAASGHNDGPSIANESEKKIAGLIDNCRISWGKVIEVGKGELRVRHRPLVITEGRLTLGGPSMRRVRYNSAVKPFGTVRKGDVVSLHWGYACDVLSATQALNIAKYTRSDLRQVNRFLEAEK